MSDKPNDASYVHHYPEVGRGGRLLTWIIAIALIWFAYSHREPVLQSSSDAFSQTFHRNGWRPYKGKKGSWWRNYDNVWVYEVDRRGGKP